MAKGNYRQYLNNKAKNLSNFKFVSYWSSFLHRNPIFKKVKLLVIEIDDSNESNTKNNKNIGFIAVYLSSLEQTLEKKIAKQFKQLIEQNIRFKLKQYAKAFEESLFALKTIFTSSEFKSNEFDYQRSERMYEDNDDESESQVEPLKQVIFRAVLYLNGKLIVSKYFQDIYFLKDSFIQLKTTTGQYLEYPQIEQQGNKVDKQESKSEIRINEVSKYVDEIDPSFSQNIQQLVITSTKEHFSKFEQKHINQFPYYKSYVVRLQFLSIDFLKPYIRKSIRIQEQVKK